MDVELVSEWQIIVAKLKNVIKIWKGEWKNLSFVVSEEAIYSFKNGSEAFSIGINASATPIDPALVKSIGGFNFFIEKSHIDYYLRPCEDIEGYSRRLGDRAPAFLCYS